MTAKVINITDELIILKPTSDNNNLRIGENVILKSSESDYLQKIRSLFWVLIQYIAKNDKIVCLGEQDKVFFNGYEDENKTIEKLYTLIRFRTDTTEVNYNRDGLPMIVAKHMTGASQDEWSELYQKSRQYFARYIDLTEYEEQHEKKMR